MRKLLKLAFCSGVFSLLFLLTPAQPTHAATCGPTTAFKMTVKTDNIGTSNANSFTIPTTGSGYGYTVDINGNDNWIDVNPGSSTFNETTNRTGAATIDFGAPGTYTIGICGNFPRIYFNNSGDRQKVLAVTQWGDNQWTSMQNAFYGAINLDVTATDAPDLSSLTNLSLMFRGATSLVGNSSFNSWDTGNVTNMASMFRATPFNQDINNWNTSSVTSMNATFLDATSFNQPLDNWNTSSVINMSALFQNTPAFNQDINNWNTSSVTNMASMFNDAASFNQPIGNWNTSSVTAMQNMFLGATSFNHPISDWGVGNVINMASMFRGASSFNQNISNWDTSSATSMFGMFSSIVATTDLPNITFVMLPMSFNQDLSSWNTSNVTNMSVMFNSDIDSLAEYYQSLGYTNITITGDTSLTHPFSQSLGNWDIGNVTGMIAMLGGTSLSEQNYDATLTGWSTQTLQPNVTLGAHGLNYCTAGDARQSIIDQDWTIEGDSEYCTLLPDQVGDFANGLASTGTSRTTLQIVGYAMGGIGALYIVYRLRQKHKKIMLKTR